MNWSTIKNHRSANVTVGQTPPWQLTSPSKIPANLSKEGFRNWCAAETTDHVFYSPYIGLNPALRIGRDNPCRAIAGFVADYDSDLLVPMSTKDVADMVEQGLKKKGIRPAYLSRTFSGKARLVWEFEKPLPGDPAELSEKALAKFIEAAGIKRLLPGYDSTSAATSQFFELGHDWTDMKGTPVDAALLATCVFEAGKKMALKVDGEIAIPLEDVAAEFERRWPGQWPGEFKFGARGPLVWLQDGITRVGCQIGDFGMICYSDRAGKGFVSWKEILGSQFVSAYESKIIGKLLDNVYYDGLKYWIRLADGRWAPHAKEDTLLVIRESGFSTAVEKGQRLSDAEKALLAIQRTRRIDGVVPFLFNPDVTVNHQGELFLNCSTRKPMAPAGGNGDPSNWPWLFNYLAGLLEADPCIPTDPIDHLMAWLKRLWEAGRAGRMELGHLLVIAGEANMGKSLFGQFILREIMGGGTDASSYLLNAGGFNKQLAEVAIWNVDDSVSVSNFNDHRKFSEMLKKSCANPEVKYHPKYRDAMVLPWRGRVVITCNTDASSLDILPQLDGTILDKIMLFRLKKRPEGFAFPESKVLEATIRAELPHFLDWLSQWTPPDDVRGTDNRYGVIPYHHTELIGDARERSPEQNLADIVDDWAEQRRTATGETEWSGKPFQLLSELLMTENLRDLVRHYKVEHIGRLMKKLWETRSPRFTGYANGARRNRYTIKLD